MINFVKWLFCDSNILSFHLINAEKNTATDYVLSSTRRISHTAQRFSFVAYEIFINSIKLEKLNVCFHSVRNTEI